MICVLMFFFLEICPIIPTKCGLQSQLKPASFQHDRSLFLSSSLFPIPKTHPYSPTPMLPGPGRRRSPGKRRTSCPPPPPPRGWGGSPWPNRLKLHPGDVHFCQDHYSPSPPPILHPIVPQLPEWVERALIKKLIRARYPIGDSEYLGPKNKSSSGTQPVR